MTGWLPKFTRGAATNCDRTGTWVGRYYRLTWLGFSIELQVTRIESEDAE